VGLVSTVALVGACGASDGGAESTAEPAPAVSVPGDLQMSGSGASSDETASSTADTGEEDPDDEAAAVDGEKCAEMQQAWSATNRALVSLSPEHPRALVESFRAGYTAMTSVEPTDEVEPSWAAMSDYLGTAVEAFEDVDEDDAGAVSNAMAGAITTEDTAGATAAAQEVTDYLATTCDGR
jgi:hypothetical protein